MPTVYVAGQPVYYALSGQGEPALVLIHGAGGDHTLWGAQLQALQGAFTVAALDLNGHGRSPLRAGEGLESYLEDALAVLAALGRPTVVAGHSLGGAVALRTALSRPENLAGLALIDSGARLRVLPKLLQLIEEDFDGALDYLLGLLFHRAEPEAVQGARAQLARNGRAALLRDFRACDGFDAMAHLEEVSVPALVCVGEQDQMTPLKYAQFLADHLPNAQLEVIPRAGHMPMVEQPGRLSQALAAFLGSLPTAA